MRVFAEQGHILNSLLILVRAALNGIRLVQVVVQADAAPVLQVMNFQQIPVYALPAPAVNTP